MPHAAADIKTYCNSEHRHHVGKQRSASTSSWQGHLINCTRPKTDHRFSGDTRHKNALASREAGLPERVLFVKLKVRKVVRFCGPELGAILWTQKCGH